MSDFDHDLGDHVRDQITGVEGTVVARSEHLTGCNRYGVAPEGDGTDRPTTEWFDEDRLVYLGVGACLEASREDGHDSDPSRKSHP